MSSRVQVTRYVGQIRGEDLSLGCVLYSSAGAALHDSWVIIIFLCLMLGLCAAALAHFILIGQLLEAWRGAAACTWWFMS